MIGQGGNPRDGTRVDPGVYDAATDLLRRRAGLLFPASRRPTVEAAMLCIMRRSGIADGPTLVKLLDEDGAIFDDFVAEVTIGESYFFREAAQFELIRSRVIPELIAARPGRRIRAWSAASAAGEEAYSIAITLAELQIDGEVIGTDISRPRLRAARHGEYRQWALRGADAAMVSRWFRSDGDRYTVAAAARQHTTFRYLNLAEDVFPSLSSGVWGMDLILCRNVLIYFDPPTIDRVCRALLDSLSDDGWLLLGAADPPLTGMDAAEVIETPAGLAYRRVRPGSPKRPRQVAVYETVTVTPVISQPVPPPENFSPPEAGITPALPDRAPQDSDRPHTAYWNHDYASVVALVEAEQSAGVASNEHQILLVRALANLGRLVEAGRLCASLLDAQRDVAELHYLHSVLLMESGRPADAAVAAKRALYLDRGMIVAHLAAATAAARAGDGATATRALMAAERLLSVLAEDSVVAASDGTTAGRLLEMTRVQRRLHGGRAS